LSNKPLYEKPTLFSLTEPSWAEGRCSAGGSLVSSCRTGGAANACSVGSLVGQGACTRGNNASSGCGVGNTDRTICATGGTAGGNCSSGTVAGAYCRTGSRAGAFGALSRGFSNEYKSIDFRGDRGDFLQGSKRAPAARARTEKHPAVGEM
jgi:hypothetical protein